MPRKGLHKDAIVDAAIDLIEKEGNHAFSLNELARRLGIKPASLYNHFENMDELTGEVGYRIASMIRHAELEAIADQSGDRALLALCESYRSFALGHIDLYKVIMAMQKDKNARTEAACAQLIDPILRVLSDYSISEEAKMHWQRILRATMHGFITHEYAGGFCHFPVACNDTYRIAIETIISGLHTAQKEQMK